MDEELIERFLQTNYPILRIKDKRNHFKRAMNLDNSIVFLSDKNAKEKIFNELSKTLNLVFGFDDPLQKKVLKSFLNL